MPDDFLHRWHEARKRIQDENDALLKKGGSLPPNNHEKSTEQKDLKPH